MTQTLFMPPSARVDSLAERGVDVSLIAQLAFARAGADSVAEGRHLALLPIESLELDLSDPAQCQFGDYELLELIGEGGMGVVYRARQLSLDREVAIKLLAAGVWASKEFVERFRREAQNAARMQHPNIVPVYEVGDHDGLHFFSMRLIGGPSLAAELKREKKLSPQRAAQLLRTIAEAVDYAHRLGVLHLDLKPANVLIDENGIPHVADFGLARRIDSALAADSDEVSGTPSYMAPEQASPRASRITRATDIWGLGAILYELVTGEPPFLAHTPQETLKLVVEGTLRNPRRHVPDLPRDLEAIILKCMAYRVEERYASARDLGDDLSSFLEGRAVRARPLNPAQRALRWARREPKLAAAVLAAFAALLVGLGATTQQWRRADANAHQAQDNAAVARAHLWDSRNAESLRLIESGDGWNAAPLLVANVVEMETAGVSERAAAERKKLGILERRNPQLIDVVDFPGEIGALAFSADGTQLAIGFGTLPVAVYDIATGKTRAFADPRAAEPWTAMDFDRLGFGADGQALFAVGKPGARMLPNQLPFELIGNLATMTWRGLTPTPDAHEFTGADGLSDDARLAVVTDQSALTQFWSLDPWRPLSPKRKLIVNPGLPFVFPVFAPDHSYVACTHHGELEFVDPLTLRETPVHLPADFGLVRAWAISPDSRWLVVSDDEGHALAIDHESARTHPITPEPTHAVRWFTFSRDGTRLAGAAGEGGVYLWHWPSGGLIAPPFGGPLPVEHVALDDHNRVLVNGSTSADKALRDAHRSNATAGIWEVLPAANDVDRVDALRVGDQAEVPAARTPVAWHTDTGLVADSLGALRVSRLPASPLKLARAAPIRPATLRFDGRHLTAVDGNRVTVVDAIRETPVAGPFEFAQPPSFAQLSSDGAALIVVVDHHLHVYDVAGGTRRFAPIELTNSPLHVELSPDGRRVATGWLDQGADRSGEIIELWDLADGRRCGGPARVPGPLDELLFSASGRRLLAWSAEAVSLRDGETLAPIAGALQDLRAPAFRKRFELGVFQLAAFDGDDPLLLAVRSDGTEIQGSDLQRYQADGSVRSETANRWKAMLALPLSKQLMVIAGDDPAALRAPGGDVRELNDSADAGAERGHALAASRDGRWLARSLRDGVELFDARDGKRLVRLHAPLALPDRVWQLAFSPDGNRLLAASMHNRWLVFDLQSDARPVAAIRRELELRSIGHREGTAASREPVSNAERAGLRADDPGPPVAAPAAVEPAGVRELPSGTIMARNPQAPATALDLTNVYNRALGATMPPTLSAPSDYAWLPRGLQRLLGVDYDVRGAIQLRDADGFVEKWQVDTPASMRVPLPQPTFAAVDVLSLVNFGLEENTSSAVVVLNYADSTQAELPIRVGADIHHWRRQSEFGETARLATLGYDARILPEFWRRVHIYAVHLANPHPEKPVRELVLRAGKGAGGSPVVFAITLQPVAAASARSTP